LIELARIPFVKSFTARIFHENGLKTVAAVASAELKQLVELLEKAQPKKLRLKGEGEGKMKKRLEERATIILDAAQNIYGQDCMAEVD
jgi:DNA polymerase theta